MKPSRNISLSIGLSLISVGLLGLSMVERDPVTFSLAMQYGLAVLVVVCSGTATQTADTSRTISIPLIWGGLTAGSGLALAGIVPPSPRLSLTEHRYTVELVLSGVMLFVSQILSLSEKPASVSDRRQGPVPLLRELALITLLSSGLSFAASMGTSMASVLSLALRIWGVLIGGDGLLQIVLSFIEGVDPLHTLGRNEGLRHLLFASGVDIDTTPTDTQAVNLKTTYRMVMNGVLACLIPLAVLAWIATGIVIVNPQEQALYFRNGRIGHTLTPGIHFTLPVPFSRIERLRVEPIRSQTIGFVAHTTDLRHKPLSWTQPHGDQEIPFVVGDGTELVSVNAILSYRVSPDAGDVLAYATQTVNHDQILRALAHRTLTLQTRGMSLDDLLNTDLELWCRTLRDQLQSESRSLVPGVEICAIDVLSIHPPVEVAGVFLDQISARIDAERVEMSARGDSLSEHQRSEMMAYSTVADAKAAASKRITAVTDEHAYVSALAAVDLADPAVVRQWAFCRAMLEALEHKPFVLLETSLLKSVRLWFQSGNSIDGKAGVAP